MNGKIFLIPTPINNDFSLNEIDLNILKVVKSLRYFIVEEIKTARRFIKKISPESNINELTFFVLNEHTKSDYQSYIEPVFSGHNIGLMSEAGCPAIADPGSQITSLAQKKEIEIVPLVGPSSIILALMASGLNGQNFAFCGYLPVKPPELKNKIIQLEKRSKFENQTQIFIEAPYRNNSMLKSILENCNNNTMLCIACNITHINGFVKTKTISEWKKNLPEINKLPVVFLISAHNLNYSEI